MSTNVTAIDPRRQPPASPPTPGPSALTDSPSPPKLTQIACVAVVALAFASLLWLHGEALWRLSYYQFFPFVFVGSVVLAWSRWDDVETLVPGSSGPALAGALVAWVFLAVAEVIFSPAVAYVGALILLASAIYRLGGMALFRAMLPAWGFLWILVPLPFRLGQYLLLTLQTIATQWSSFVLDLPILHVFHFREGNVIEIAGQRLLVEEACTGANSLFAVVACCIFLIFWTRQRWYRALLLLAASIGWVLITNAIRIITIAVVYDKYQVDLGNGVRHSLLGFACFALAVLLIWSTDRLFAFLFPRWGEERVRPARQGPVPLLTAADVAGLGTWPIAALFALPLAFHFLTPMFDVTPTPSGPTIVANLEKIKEGTLKNVAPGWTFVKYEESTRLPGIEFGNFSKTWLFKKGPMQALVSLDYPFPMFHDLWVCY